MIDAGATDMQVTVGYTGLMQLHFKRYEESITLEAGATLGQLCQLLQGQGADFAGYFALVELPGQRGVSVPLERAGATPLVQDSRITFVYRFAGG